MAPKKLIMFIQNHLKKGYKIDEIKLHLVQKGYSTKNIRDAINYFPKHKMSKRSRFLWLFMIAIFGFIIVFGIMTCFFPPEQPLEIETTLIKELKTEKIDKTKDLTLAEQIKEQKEFVPEKTQALRAYTKTPKSHIYTTTYTIEEIKQISIKDSERAARLCEDHLNPDKCFNTVAKTVKNSILCDKIKNSFTKDNCLMFFIFSGQDVCNKLTNPNLKTGCNLIVQEKNTK